MAKSKKKYNKKRSINKKKRSRLQRGGGWGFKGKSPKDGWQLFLNDVVTRHPTTNPFDITGPSYPNPASETPICDWSKNKDIYNKMLHIDNESRKLQVRICSVIEEKKLIVEAVKRALAEFSTNVSKTYTEIERYKELEEEIDEHFESQQHFDDAGHHGYTRNEKLENEQKEIRVNSVGKYLFEQQKSGSDHHDDFSKAFNTHMNKAISKINTQRSASGVMPPLSKFSLGRERAALTPEAPVEV